MIKLKINFLINNIIFLHTKSDGKVEKRLSVMNASVFRLLFGEK